MVVGQTSKDQKKNELNHQQIGLLDSIEFTWTIWEDRFEEMNLFKATHGHCRVPRSNHNGLGRWVSHQRTQYRLFREGKKSQLNEHRINLLNRIGFSWTIHVAWEDRLEEVKLFKATHGHCRVTGAITKN